MATPSRAELLETVRVFLDRRLPPALVAPDLAEYVRLSGQLALAPGVPADAPIASMEIAELGPASAAVDVRQGGGVLTVYAAREARWKIVDLAFDGHRIGPTLRRVLVEPSVGDGLGVAALAFGDPSGETILLVGLRNESERTWRLRCAGVVRRFGPLRFISEIPRRRLRRVAAVDYEPGSEHAVALRLQPDASRVWLRLRRDGARGSLLFALTWEEHDAAAPHATRRRLREFALYWAPLLAFSGFLAATKGLGAALAFSLLIPIIAVHGDVCVRRLERKLALLRRQSA
jgi:hypothetical protein